ANGTGFKSALWWAFAFSAFYAATDEVHQLFIPGRSGEARDVLIDSTGAAAGLTCYWLVAKFNWQNRKTAQTNW
ncbi:VanZ family protein, partial [Peribacillus sp. SIMBA_075]|uniref:VanZ family protein n=1 Tax=Peribacillus sp. SIMBA_075 TaxID=3085813 RepID=UPI00397C679C